MDPLLIIAAVTSASAAASSVTEERRLGMALEKVTAALDIDDGGSLPDELVDPKMGHPVVPDIWKKPTIHHVPTLWESYEFAPERLHRYSIESGPQPWWGVRAEEWSEIGEPSRSGTDFYRQLHLAFLGRRRPVEIEIKTTSNVVGVLTVRMFEGQAQVWFFVSTLVENPAMREILRMSEGDPEHVFLDQRWTIQDSSFIGVMERISEFWKEDFDTYESTMRSYESSARWLKLGLK